MDLSIINKIIEKIPLVIVGIREFVVGVLRFVKLDSYYPLIVFILAMIASYYLLKQWIVTSQFWKLKTILNMLLIALLIFIIFVYVR